MGIAGSVKSAGLSLAAAAERILRKHPAARTAKNLLILQHAAALGTVVHTTPLIEALKAAVPGCRIRIVASGMSREIYKSNPHVEAVFTTPNPVKDPVGAARALRALKPFGGEPFCTVTPLGNERSTVVLQAVWGGSATRVGFTLLPQFYEVPLAWDQNLSQIANNLRIVEGLGHTLPASSYEPRIDFAPEDLAFAKDLLRETGAPDGQKIAIFVTQTSVTQRKSWRPERFRAAAQFLHDRYNAHIVFVGTAQESASIDALRQGLDFPTANIAGKTNLLQLAALLSLAHVGLTLDTGTMHVARAVALPMVIVAPAWSPPGEWLPLGNPRYRIFKNLDMPAATPDYIIDEVSVDEVTTALADLITRYPNGPSS